MKKEVFGKTPEGIDALLYVLENKNGMRVKITNFGGTITSVLFPDKRGKTEDVVLGFNTLDGYLSKNNPYLGCTVGRYANRIANGQFTLEGKQYTVAKNDGPNHLHGGLKGFDKVVWESNEIEGDGFSGLELNYLSKGGEEGYPGNLKVKVIYKLTENNEIEIDYKAETDAVTHVCLTNHSYFNLCGNAKRDVLEHDMQLLAEAYTPVNQDAIPLGEIKPVNGTAFDFRQFKKIGKEINMVEGGYDHNFVVGKADGDIKKIGEVREYESGRCMEVFTSEPGVQLYTGNFLTGEIIGKEGTPYKKQFGFCLETQHFPDSPNQPHFPSTILKPGETYSQQTIYKFSIIK